MATQGVDTKETDDKEDDEEFLPGFDTFQDYSKVLTDS